MTKLYMKPRVVDFGGEESGIRRVVEAYEHYLPEFGYEFVDDPAMADLTIGHASAITDPDVVIIHGLYWTSDYGVPAPKWEHGVNHDIINAVRYSKQATVTASWVREVFKRDMRLSPTIVPHGIEWDEWQGTVAKSDRDYVLWNKNRSGVDVCSTDDMERLASMNTNTLFLSTFANDKATPNVQKIGLQPHDEMIKYVKNASVYLATVKETFGIGILEAMAAGVPVLGWHGGGIEDLIVHGVNGYLVQRGDFEGLNEGLRYCLKHRKTLGDNGREMAKQYTWRSAVEKLHYVLQTALIEDRPYVSVIIPCYNYGEKVENAIESVLLQTLKPIEIIVVDDGSNEQQAEMILAVCEQYHVTYLRKENGGVATARNAGIAASMGKYVCCLDADDAIAPTFLETCVNALVADRSLSLAYTGLTTVWPDGRRELSQWPGEYDFDRFIHRQNQVPTCCVFSYDMWERLGGYNQKYAPTGAGSEDAEFFLRAGAYGFKARKVTGDGLFLYSIGVGHTSKKGYTEVDWTAMHPWVRDGRHPFASLATPSNGFCHPVRQYDEPTISVIVPIGPGHERHVVNVLDSLESQSFRKWEVILVFDNNDPDRNNAVEMNDSIAFIETAYPYARTIINKLPHKGAGWARNEGVKIARSPLLLFVDADDWLYPEALQTMYTEWVATGGVVYSDYVGKAIVNDQLAMQTDKEQKLLAYNQQTGEAVISHRSADYNCVRAQMQPDVSDMYIWNLITSLTPISYHHQIGGFDERMESWEDWDYWIRMAKSGICFHRIAEPLVVYRFNTGNRRETGLQQYPHLIQYMQDKYIKTRSTVMPCTSCGGKNAANPNPVRSVEPIEGKVNTMADSDFVLVSYDHPNMGQHKVVGAMTKMMYGYRGGGEQFYAHKDDIAAQPDIFHPIHTTADIAMATPVPEPPKPIVPVKEPEPVIVQAEDNRNDLQRVPGISDYVARGLNEIGVYTIEDLVGLSKDTLLTVQGIGMARANTIIEFIEKMNKDKKE